ncbi:methyltransferase domain-containing protein [Bacillus horti]|uniref:Ubiquinone/menaquinone biosynthesis C-methylase UbiE n=1 Tax=Caldalkalibacillus horti TaxID=77523 RepID=A0ABT9VXF0_9BACI|nr:methyltransferase domain-containing protein [Bacillus horti]MDQ0165667.1 ubiquinone/menaquinone biosynthesis C-methylase UbiE [Bacillus horti]
MFELGKKEMDGLLRFNQQTIPVYIYTPLCGTCKVTTKMLEIVEAALPELKLYSCNLNAVTEVAERWKIESVPCLAFIQGAQVQKKIYAFKSVDEVYEMLKPFACRKSNSRRLIRLEREVMRVKKLTNEDFDQMVTFFDQMAQTSWLSSIHAELATYVPQQNGIIALDVGCGTGRFLQRIQHQIAEGIGIDLSPEMIREANRQADLLQLTDRFEFRVGDAYELPLKNESVDVAISTCMMFLLPEPEKGIEELHRVLKKQGTLLMLNPSPLMNPEQAYAVAKEQGIPQEEWEYLWKWSNVSTRKHRYAKEELKSMLQPAFTQIEIVDVLDGLAHITIGHKS